MGVLEQIDIYQMRIVLLNDQPVSSVQIVRALRQEGFQNFSSLSDPIEIIEVLNETDNPIDLLLLDLDVSEDRSAILGMLIAQTGQSEKPAIITLTNDGDKSSRVALFKAGASDYLIKPFDSIELIKRIEMQLDTRALIQKLKIPFAEQNNHLESLNAPEAEGMAEDYQEVMARLAQASEYRYYETGARIKRVSRFVELIALELGLDREFAKRLRNAAPLHDIGKIGISDKIMLKPGRLTYEEFEVMKTHVTIGAKILEGHSSDFLKLAHDIALTHHEKFDGTGYPNNLMGNSIPLCGRIVAIADVFDALTSVRVYKKARTVEYAIELIKAEKGKHFDPEVVDCFFKKLPQILEIKDKYVDVSP